MNTYNLKFSLKYDNMKNHLSLANQHAFQIDLLYVHSLGTLFSNT